jgi:hypothetical protein
MATINKKEEIMEKESLKIIEEESPSLQSLYDKLNDLKDKFTFIGTATRKMLATEDYFPNDDIINGMQLITYSLEDEFDEINTMLNTLFKYQHLLESAKAGITMTEEGAWIKKNKAIEVLNESIHNLDMLVDYTNNLEEEIENLMVKAHQLLEKLGKVK